jgi:small subunit ribosomal protein S17
MPETTTPTATARGHRKERVGEVVSNKMTKTIVVRVQRRFPHPRYKKVVTAFSKFYAHDEKSEAKIGDTVRIEETRPLSRLKCWRLVAVVEKSSGVERVAA